MALRTILQQGTQWMNLHSSFRFSCALRSSVSRKGEKEGEREEEHVAALQLDSPSRVL